YFLSTAYVGLGEAAKRSIGSAANQIPDMSFFSSNMSTNGYSKLPGGLIIQWGWFAVDTTNGVVSNKYVNLPIAMPTALLSVIAMFSTQDPSVRSVGFNTALTSRSQVNFTYVTPTTNSIFFIVMGC
ncbi:TPA: gp53-like domain-containing protein, partial [Enterobacter hormaechei]